MCGFVRVVIVAVVAVFNLLRVTVGNSGRC